MEYMHNNCGYQSNPLDIKQLAEFDAAISQFSQSEQRRRRIFYLRDAVAKVRIGKSMLKGFKWFLIPMAIIPVFWPFFIFFWFFNKKANSILDNQLENALDYWGIHQVEIDQYISDDSDSLIPGL